MATAESKDKIVKELLKIVKDKKEAIAKAEKPTWETNCTFSPTGGTADRVNLNVETDLNVLIGILGFLINKKNSFFAAAEMLGLKIEFKHQGFSFDAWAADIKTRVNKVEIAKKRAEVEEIESRLNKLISKEERELIELEALSSMVKGL